MSEHRDHKRLLDSLSTAVLEADDALRVRYMNPAAEALLAVSRSRALGAPLAEVLFEVDEGGNPLEVLRQTLITGHPFTKREARLKVGFQEIVVDYMVAVLTEPGAKSALLIEMQQMDRLLRISREEALLANHQATRALVRGVAHEIKNPLGGIRGAAQLLARALDADSDLVEYTQVIIEEADRLRALADRMLGPRKLPKLQAVNIHECLERVRTLILAETGTALEIRRDYDISLPELRADPDQLIQSLLNIAGNAKQALLENPSERAPAIVLRTRPMRQFTIGSTRHRLVLRVDITDNGPGIPADMLETIFYPMVSGRAAGTGLGLSIAQDIIHQYHGLIECESRPGATTFSILIPLEQDHDNR